MRVHWQEGVWLPDLGLALDPQASRPWAFVSHAHSDHTRRHEHTVLTPETAALLRVRLGGELGHLAEIPYQEVRALSALSNASRFSDRSAHSETFLRLLPAGHILGSAQLFLENDTGSLLYTGDFKIRSGLSCSAAEFCKAETLIMETTYGLPRYVFPPAAEVVEAIVSFCQETLEDGDRPVLLGYSLGKSQEVLAALAGVGLPLFLHESVARLTQVYRELGVALPFAEVFRSGEERPGVFLAPPHLRGSRFLERIPRRRVAYLSGWALDPSARHRWGCDAVFPLSDHADYEELLTAVERVQPRRVLTLHGFAAEFAQDLRARGIEAYALNGPDQLDLGLPVVCVSQSLASEEENLSPAFLDRAGFGRFCLACEEIAKHSGKLAKVRIVADFLRKLRDNELSRCAVWLSGHPFPKVDEQPLGLGSALLRRALEEAVGTAAPQVRPTARRLGDLGRAAEALLATRTTIRRPEVLDIQALFYRIREMRSSVARLHLLAEWLGSLCALEACYLIKLCLGDLRIGVQAGVIEEALALAFSQDVDAVRQAHMLLGDLGKTALLARQNRLATASMTLFRPVACMLAGSDADDAAAWARLARPASSANLARPARQAENVGSSSAGEILWVEPKLDGVRAQLHFGAGRAEIFSRDLRCMSEMFPEICRAALALPGDGVLDGEILAFQEGRALDFAELQKRLGRREADLFLEAEIPVFFMAFDCLWKDGTPLLRAPLRERRAALESWLLTPPLERVPVQWVTSAEAIGTAFRAARQQGHEGLLLKDPLAAYSPGKRGLSWLKRKEALATLDVVVVAVEYGHGKRAGVLSDYTFAVRDESSGRFLTLGKAYTGLTDAELVRCTETFLALECGRKGRRLEVEPVVVIEVAFDAIRPSSRHASGLALRFPRIKRLRPDKAAHEIDTLQTARQLAGVA